MTFFDINSENDFEQQALDLFLLHAQHNEVYREYLDNIKCQVNCVNTIKDIPFLPIEFFKTHKVVLQGYTAQNTFLSSGTTTQNQSKHYVVSEDLYIKSFSKGFQHFFGVPQDYAILALLPSYLEQGDSSLVYMVDHLIKQSEKTESGFYLDNDIALVNTLQALEKKAQKTILIGVSYALLNLIKTRPMQLNHTIIMETGGMKGRQKELIKRDLHDQLKKGFGVSKIYSEYGMTELFSQAYALGTERFKTVPWMKVLIREVEDPYHYLNYGKTGGINIIDLANYYSCPFIETQDLGRLHSDGSFEVLGRFDFSDIRGCNLMIE